VTGHLRIYADDDQPGDNGVWLTVEQVQERIAAMRALLPANRIPPSAQPEEATK
jgi:hypothetical protein